MIEGQHRKTRRPLLREIDIYIAAPLDQLGAQAIFMSLMARDATAKGVVQRPRCSEVSRSRPQVRAAIRMGY
jgi:hypothetical protein